MRPLIVGIFTAWVLRLAFNLHNYACKCFYLFSHILSLSCHSLQHCRGFRRGSPSTAPLRLTANPHRPGSQYRFVAVLVSFLHSCPVGSPPVALLHATLRACAFLARRRARSLRGAASRARLPCAAIPCAVQNRARMNGRLAFPARPAPRRAGNARAARSPRCAFAFPAVPF